MEREIKFRGLDMDNNWVYGSLVNTTQGLHNRPKQQTKTWIITSSFGNGGWFNIIGRSYVKQNSVCQFTGLKSSDGIDIYEGDIVYLAGYGEYEVKFPFIELYEAYYNDDIGAVLGNIKEDNQ